MGELIDKVLSRTLKVSVVIFIIFTLVTFISVTREISKLLDDNIPKLNKTIDDITIILPKVNRIVDVIDSKIIPYTGRMIDKIENIEDGVNERVSHMKKDPLATIMSMF